MAYCGDCKCELTADNTGQNGEKCRDCWRRRYRQALSDAITISGEGTMDTPSGWTTMGTVDGLPVVQLCDHDHATEHEAEACLASRPPGAMLGWLFRRPTPPQLPPTCR